MLLRVLGAPHAHGALESVLYFGANQGKEDLLKWYEHITESRWFRKADDPKTRVGHIAVTLTALTLALVAFVQNPSQSHNCSTNPLRGVYNPKRLKVIQTCRTITGTVVHAFHERDGDIHIQLDVADKSLLTKKNYTNQSGYLVAEYMPSDPYPRPTKGEKLQLNCTYVYDLQHGGWAECHPVWSVQPLGPSANHVEP